MGADANRMNLAFVEETTFGSFPGTALQNIRHTGESFKQDTSTVTSSIIRSDRNIQDLIRTGVSGAGGFNFEFAYGDFDLLLEALLMSSDWEAPITDVSGDTGISAVNATNTFEGVDDEFINYDVGQWIQVSGFTEAANNGLFKIVSITHSGSPTTEYDIMTVEGGTLADEAAGDSVSITQGGYIVNGTEFRSFAWEKEYEDLTTTFETVTGCFPNTFDLTFASDTIITGSFGFMGKKAASATATGGTGTNTAASTTTIMNAIDNVHAFFENLTSYDITNFSMSVNNNARARLQVGTLGAISIGTGSINISGSHQAYFDDATEVIAAVNKYLNDTALTESSLVLQLVDADTNYYVIDIPAIKYTDAERVAGGINTDIILNLSWQAIMDASENIAMRMVRFPSS